MKKANLILIMFLFHGLKVLCQVVPPGRLLYEKNLERPEDTIGWRLEGKAEVTFEIGWMHLQSPNQAEHHVFWCPTEFPSDFIAEWEVKNQNPKAGLCIVFFSTEGTKEADIFSPKLLTRTGVFKQYTKGDINNYHISYYANNPNEKGRINANLRKNKGFKLVQSLTEGIPKNDTLVHRCQLVKKNGRIVFFVDSKKVIDWQDTQAWGGGRIGFRQMKWTHFAYRNFKVWESGEVVIPEIPIGERRNQIKTNSWEPGILK